MSARLQFCLHPGHSYSNEDKAGAWFLSAVPAKYCPKHQDKPRLRFDIDLAGRQQLHIARQP